MQNSSKEEIQEHSTDLETTEKTLIDLSCAREWMELALKWAQWSPDPSTQCGAVIVAFHPDRAPTKVGAGFNGFHVGVEPRLERPAKYDFIEHAERMACHDMFDRIQKGLVSIDKATELVMFAPWAACGPCANSIRGHNIKYLVRMTFPLDDEAAKRWEASCANGDAILKESGVGVIEYAPTEPFGIELLRDGQLYKY